VTLVGAVVVVVTGVVGLIFLFLPELKPEPLPPQRRVELSREEFDPDATFAEFIERRRVEGMKPSDFTKARLSQRGALLTYRVRIVGYKNDRLPLDWQLIDETTGEEVYEEQASILRPTVEDDTATRHIWARLPRQEGPYYISVQLLLQHGNNFTELARLRSKTFPGLPRGSGP
jgi:hypothetical protein